MYTAASSKIPSFYNEVTSLFWSKKGQNATVSNDGEISLELKPTEINLIHTSFPLWYVLWSIYCYPPKRKQQEVDRWVRAYECAVEPNKQPVQFAECRALIFSFSCKLLWFHLLFSIRKWGTLKWKEPVYWREKWKKSSTVPICRMTASLSNRYNFFGN